MNEKNLDNKKENSILSMYENVKKVNSFKDLIIENNEQVLNEFSKYDSQILNIKNELNILQGNLAQTQTNTLNDIKILEDKLNTDYINMNKTTKDEINKTIKEIIAQIEEDKKTNEELVISAISKLNVEEIKNSISTIKKENDDKISELEHNIEKSINELKETNKAYFITDIENTKNNLEQKIDNIKETNEKFIVSNIEDIKANISSVEANTFNKIEELEQELRNIIGEEKEQNKKILIETISNLNIDEIRNNISNLETSNEKKIKKLESNLNKSIEEIQETKILNIVTDIENTKNDLEQKINTIRETISNIEDIKTNISSIENNTFNKIEELEQELRSIIDEDKEENQRNIINAITNLNIDDIKKDISKVETINEEKIERLKFDFEKYVEQNNNVINEKIEELNYFDTIRNLENSLLEVKEIALNTECSSKVISKKVEELDSLNQKKLDKVRKEQEKFIVSKISELDSTDEISNIKNDLEQITKKLQDIEILSKQIQVDSLSQMQSYIEKRLLKMKYVATIQTITKNISELRKKVELLENAQNDEDTIKENIELIISKRLKEQEEGLIKNIESLINKKLREQENQFKKHVEFKIGQISKEYNNTYIENLVEEKIREVIKKQKAKKTSQLAVVQKQQEYAQNLRMKNEKNTIKVQKTTYPSKPRTNTEIINSIYNAKKSKSKNSLDDMVATLSNMPNVKTSKTKKSINTLAKTIKKSQILNYDN